MTERADPEGQAPEGEGVGRPASEETGGPPSSAPASEEPAAAPAEADAASRAAGTLPQSPAGPEPEPPRDHSWQPGDAEQAAVRRRRRNRRERIIGGVLFACSAVSILTTIGIVVVLVTEAFGFFLEVSPVAFLTGTRWTPLFQPQHFGVLPLLAGSVQIAVGAAIIALPIGLATAVFLSEYAPDRMRRIVKPALEVLAGIPTVVYGYFALTFITPLLRGIFGQETVNIFNAASGSLVVGIMIIPMVASLSEDAMQAVPDSLRQGAYALGATKFEVATRTVVPAALSGVVASFILALSRAIGETMAVTIAAGMTPKLTLNPFESIQTMTAYIVQVSLGETPFGTIEYKTIFAVGLLLFVITLIMNIASIMVLRRFREVYE